MGIQYVKLHRMNHIVIKYYDHKYNSQNLDCAKNEVASKILICSFVRIHINDL